MNTKIIHKITTCSHQEQLKSLLSISMVQPLKPTYAQPQEIHSFIKYVLPKNHKHKAPIIKNWTVQKEKNQAVKYQEIFYFLDLIFNITPWNEQKFPEIVQRIYNTIFVSVC